MNYKNFFGNQAGEGIFSRYWDLTSLFVILLIITKLRFPFLEIPLERDEGAYAYMAQLLLEGVPPYTQAYSLYFPGLFIIYALTFLILGQTIFAIHFCLLIANLITIVIIFLIVTYMIDSFFEFLFGANIYSFNQMIQSVILS